MLEQDWQARTRLLLGTGKLDRLGNSHVLVVGLGGVGAYASELVCRAGVGKMTIVDGDIVQSSNRNRQLPALFSTEGMSKVNVVARRLLDINPQLELSTVDKFVRQSDIDVLARGNFDYVIDAIDTLSPKVALIYECLKNGIKLVSSMGAGGKMDPAKVKIADIFDSYNCRLAFYIRKRLRRMGINKGFPVVYSPETVQPEAIMATDNDSNKKSIVGTVSYMPAIFGCYCASVAIRGILESGLSENGFDVTGKLLHQTGAGKFPF